jgi:hypothetical protein
MKTTQLKVLDNVILKAGSHLTFISTPHKYQVRIGRAIIAEKPKFIWTGLDTDEPLATNSMTRDNFYINMLPLKSSPEYVTYQVFSWLDEEQKALASFQTKREAVEFIENILST